MSVFAIAATACFDLRQDDLAGDAGPDAAANDGGVDATLDASDGGVDATLDASEGAVHVGDGGVDGTLDAGDGDASPGLDANADAEASVAEAGGRDVDVGDTSVVGCVLTGAQPGAAWPMEGYCPTHRHRSPFHGPHDPALVHPVWSSPTVGDVHAGPSIAADGTVYVSAADAVYAFEPIAGHTRWTFPVGKPYVPDTPGIGRDGTVYVGDSTPKVWALAPDGGGSIGTPLTLSEATRTGPTIAGNGDLYFSLSTPEIDDVIPGGPLRRTLVPVANGNADGSRTTFGPDGVIFVGTNAPSVQAFAPDGGPLWARVFDASAGINTTFAQGGTPPALSPDGTVVAALTIPSELHAFAADSGKERWSWPLGSRFVLGVSIADDGTIYASLNDGVYALAPDGDAGAGNPFLSVGDCTWPLIDADGWLFVACAGSGIYGIDPTHTQQWRVTLNEGAQWAPADGPSLGADGTLYLAVMGASDDAGGDHGVVVAVAPR
jgi:hypothetical protein